MLHQNHQILSWVEENKISEATFEQKHFALKLFNFHQINFKEWFLVLIQHSKTLQLLYSPKYFDINIFSFKWNKTYLWSSAIPRKKDFTFEVFASRENFKFSFNRLTWSWVNYLCTVTSSQKFLRKKIKQKMWWKRERERVWKNAVLGKQKFRI